MILSPIFTWQFLIPLLQWIVIPSEMVTITFRDSNYVSKLHFHANTYDIKDWVTPESNRTQVVYPNN